VSLARSESFPFWSLALNPFESVGTMKPRMDLSLGSPLVFAQTTAIWAVDPLVIHIFEPFSSQLPSGRSRAIVIIPLGLLPKSGSVRPKQPITSPVAMRGNHRCFCVSVPKA
jgi:hypothetical protein